ncbi:hypothetical protein [Xanthobacter autotrophicus]|uniref:hypothetical protein n=1 Tax=Xanthobacter autotrophicus TaxID=280 RepID=UPI0024A71036|nr:hypothetical protein [Xanthobacter autotrophicus]MDI4657524.1 hypothetical protein [Xanthobacter autotrophicus]
MDTIKSFVETVWQRDPQVTQNGMPNPAEVWSKPDERSGSLELRRITTRQSTPVPGVFDRGVRSDFYELYWADLTAGSPWEDFLAWLRLLLWRNPSHRVPARVFSAWVALWVITILFSLVALWAAIPPQTTVFNIPIPEAGNSRWLVLAVIAAATVGLHKLVQQTFGRVVRYTQATPGNIAARKAVRERGLTLLEALHDDPEYDRIILVGHSLGTILAYELLAFFWARQYGARRVTEGTAEFDALRDLEVAAGRLEANADEPAALATWNDAQHRLRRLLAARALPGAGQKEPIRRWILSDFVTIGSPLAHAEFLMAADRPDLERRQVEREMPTAPPVRECLDPDDVAAVLAAGGFPVPADPAKTELFCFPRRDENKTWELHHAAVFGVVRWTNIFDPARFIVQGDLISGPVRGVFGPAIHDIDLAALRGPATWFSHTKYWDSAADPRQLEALRAALNLLDNPM